MTNAGATTVCLQGAKDEAIYEAPGDASIVWAQTRVIGLFDTSTDTDSVLEFIRTSLDLPELVDYSIEQLDDETWQDKWKENTQPLCFGNRLWIYPSWYTAPPAESVNVILDPGLAFGTGTHPTTAMCLEWLDQHDVSGWQLIDYGCGSGVLAIAAIKLGAAHVWAVDTDPQALEATTENARANAISQEISISSPEELPQLKADCLIANILANPILDLVARFADMLHSDGYLVLSGILTIQTDKIIAGLEPYFVIDAILERDQWIRIDARRQTCS
jgi:ribosomal protein L11 methyltransferase